MLLAADAYGHTGYKQMGDLETYNAMAEITKDLAKTLKMTEEEVWAVAQHFRADGLDTIGGRIPYKPNPLLAHRSIHKYAVRSLLHLKDARIILAEFVGGSA